MNISKPHFPHFAVLPGVFAAFRGAGSWWLRVGMCVCLCVCFNLCAGLWGGSGFEARAQQPVARPVVHPVVVAPDSLGMLPTPGELLEQAEAEQAVVDSLITERGAAVAVPDTLAAAAAQQAAADSLALAGDGREDEWVPMEVEFTPDPGKACWMSALFPGLGQVYNRRYWKLPIIVGGYLGLAYATSWNNSMLKDYTKAYADFLDNDPETKSYMDLFSPNVKEENLDRSWLQNVLKSRKNYFRRNRDLCVICMVGVYLLAMVDAYVDASLSHFDISPELSMDVTPALMRDCRTSRPSVGLVWALNF